DSGYDGPRHFDAHAYRTSDHQDVKDFARGCMRTYVILADKAQQWNEDPRVQALLQEINVPDARLAKLTSKFSPANAKALLKLDLDRLELIDKPLPYERLDQLTMEILMGIRR